MEDQLGSKGLYKITLGSKIAPTDVEKKIKWDSKNDSSCGSIGMSISPYLRFHLQGLDSPVESWKMLNTIFGIKMRFKLINLKMSYIPWTEKKILY